MFSSSTNYSLKFNCVYHIYNTQNTKPDVLHAQNICTQHTLCDLQFKKNRRFYLNKLRISAINVNKQFCMNLKDFAVNYITFLPLKHFLPVCTGLFQ